MMNDRLSLLQITALAVYSMGMAGGQILFKLAAVRSMPSRSLAERALDLIQYGYFLAALILYSVLSVLWVWILSMTPLSPHITRRRSLRASFPAFQTADIVSW